MLFISLIFAAAMPNARPGCRFLRAAAFAAAFASAAFERRRRR